MGLQRLLDGARHAGQSGGVEDDIHAIQSLSEFRSSGEIQLQEARPGVEILWFAG